MRSLDHASILALILLVFALVAIRVARWRNRQHKPQLPDVLRSRLLKAKITPLPVKRW
jgi:hypothetical protein